MDKIKKIGYEKAKSFRDKYNLGNYCGKNITEVFEIIENSEKAKIKLIRKPFIDDSIAGFIGYKYEAFIIATNTNCKLGDEIFTMAHEISHLLDYRADLKNNPMIEESDKYENDDEKEVMANAFAAELLMPKENIYELVKTLKRDISPTTIIKMQQRYYVAYKAITKRLVEIKLINKDKEKELNKFAMEENQLIKLTKQLGYSNELNEPSKFIYLSKDELELLKYNYENGYTTYDDLIRIFSYLGCTPEKFGYEEDKEISKEAIDFINDLLS